MGVLGFIQAQKEKFRATQENKRAAEITRLKAENKSLAEKNKQEEQYQKVKQENRQLKYGKVQEGAKRLLGGLKKAVNEGKTRREGRSKQGSFGFGPSTGGAFTGHGFQGFGQQPKAVPKQKRQKKQTVIIIK